MKAYLRLAGLACALALLGALIGSAAPSTCGKGCATGRHALKRATGDSPLGVFVRDHPSARRALAAYMRRHHGHLPPAVKAYYRRHRPASSRTLIRYYSRHHIGVRRALNLAYYLRHQKLPKAITPSELKLLRADLASLRAQTLGNKKQIDLLVAKVDGILARLGSGTPASGGTPSPPKTPPKTPPKVPTAPQAPPASLPPGVHSAVFAYGSTTNLGGYSKPGSLIITQPGRVNDPAIKSAAAAGAEVLVYFNFVVALGTSGLGQPDFYGGSTLAANYQWGGGYRADGYGPVLDVRAGSAWMSHAVPVVASFLAAHPWLRGVFLDDYAERRWDSGWGKLSQADRDSFTAGIRYWAPRIRSAVGSNAVLIGNGTFFAPNASLNGDVIEHHPPSQASSWSAVLGAGWYGPKHTVVIASSTAEAQAWSKVSGVTHVSSQTNYGINPEPPV